MKNVFRNFQEFFTTFYFVYSLFESDRIKSSSIIQLGLQICNQFKMLKKLLSRYLFQKCEFLFDKNIEFFRLTQNYRSFKDIMPHNP